jgi:predicted nucleotide-binding protein (sugar kinase/HSP70/actin superfamily)
MRENMGFETVPGSFANLRQELLGKLSRADSLSDLRAADRVCRQASAQVKLDKPEHPFRVGIVGELYTVMEPFSNYFVERQLAREGIAVSRVMGVWFLLFGQHRARALRHCSGYLRYLVGANGVHSVSHSLTYAKENYDGIIHMKSFGCIPELSATPALQALSQNFQIPILDLSFDTQTSETGIQTRLEAFADMIRLKKE